MSNRDFSKIKNSLDSLFEKQKGDVERRCAEKDLSG